jgi:pyruvate/2-oxoglutarate dehydrogenase complex dihydrolipoamide acyltransferase (E2) component
MESAFFSGFPRFVLMGIVRIQRILDFFGMLPQALVRDDPFYSSVFVTSLGSIGVDAVFHHLYEYGNCPFFINIGEITEKPVAEQGRVAVRNVLPVRITFDERIEDGFLASKGLAYMKDVIMNIEKYL